MTGILSVTFTSLQLGCNVCPSGMLIYFVTHQYISHKQTKIYARRRGGGGQQNKIKNTNEEMWGWAGVGTKYWRCVKHHHKFTSTGASRCFPRSHWQSWSNPRHHRIFRVLSVAVVVSHTFYILSDRRSNPCTSSHTAYLTKQHHLFSAILLKFNFALVPPDLGCQRINKTPALEYISVAYCNQINFKFHRGTHSLVFPANNFQPVILPRRFAFFNSFT